MTGRVKIVEITQVWKSDTVYVFIAKYDDGSTRQVDNFGVHSNLEYQRGNTSTAPRG